MFFLPLPETHYGYLASSRDIVISSRITRDHQTEVLAHELGHLHYGHDLRTRHESKADERKADKYAASLLIAPTEYAFAEAMHEGCVSGIAQELGVSTKLVKVWQSANKNKALALR